MMDNSLMWFITNQCNLNCLNCSSQCSIEQKQNKYFISLDKVEETLLFLKNKNIYFNNVDLTGGEALLHPDIKEICLLIKKFFPKINIQIYTNGLSSKLTSEQFLSFCHNNNIQFVVSIYPRESFLKIYENLEKNFLKYNIFYSWSRVHALFHQIYFNNTQTVKNFNDLTCPLKSYINHTYYLKNNQFYPCCETIEVFSNQKFLPLNEINKKEDLLLYTKDSLNICKECKKVFAFFTPWISQNEIKINIKTNPFDLFKNYYSLYYKLFFKKDQELSKIIYHPLIKNNLINENGLNEKQYLFTKFLNGYLDIFIYYSNLSNIEIFIEFLKEQSILNKCNLYFIKDLNSSFTIEDKKLFYSFLPFNSINYNSYFLQASNIEEAKKLFNIHSFLKYKIMIDLNDINQLKNNKFLENIYHIQRYNLN